MIISAIDPSLTDKFYYVSLREARGTRQISIPIGEFEAQSMTISMESIPIPRPLTYDLLHTVLSSYEVKIEAVEITHFYEGTYYADIVCCKGDEKIVVDARPSDAMNVALRFGAPIYASQELLDEVGYEPCRCGGEYTIKVSVSFDEGKTPDELSIEKLEQLLEQYVAQENYEEASRIQDLIDQKKQNK